MSTETINKALLSLRPLDQEILTLRHFDELTNEQAADALEITTSAAARIYVRAMRRLTDRIEQLRVGSFQPFALAETEEFSVGQFA